MKKRLLITSIVMMLVVAVALSTATYAWFTSNTRVDMGTMTLKAATSDADALGIGWLSKDNGTSIESDLYDVLKPMAPESLTVGTTVSTVDFRSATVKEEDSQVVFNDDVAVSAYVSAASSADYYTLDNTTKVAKSGVTYYNHSGDMIPATVTVGTTDVSEMYVRNFAPLTYSIKDGNNEIQAFYVKNLSPTNTISKVTVHANFTGSDVYVLTTDKTFRDKANFYYKRTGEENNYTYTVQTVNTTTSLEDNTIKVGDAITADTYYQKLDGNDLIRVAIFTKDAYNYSNAGERTTAEAASYKLLGVLGNVATVGTAVGEAAYDKNTTYFTRTGEGTAQSPYVYAQATDVTPSNYSEKQSTLYTCANTAAFGAAGLFNENDAVKDLGYYANVSTSLTLTTTLEAQDQIDIVAIAWLDGTLLDDSKASVMGQVGLYFTAA